MMRTLFFAILLGFTSVLFGAATVTSASAGIVTTANCENPAHPGGYLGVDGQCHDPSDRATVPAATTNVVSGNPAAGDSADISPYVDKQFSDFAAFKADCDAHHGHIYTAEDWNKRGIQPHLNPGQMQCYRDPSWN